MGNLHDFKSLSNFENYYYGEAYSEPFVSTTMNVDKVVVNYNKKNAWYRKMIATPLTFEFLTDGTFYYGAMGYPGYDEMFRPVYGEDSYYTPIQYSINGGEYVTESLTPQIPTLANGMSSATTIQVHAGDKISFKGNNAFYFNVYNDAWGCVGDSGGIYHRFNSTAQYKLYGNIVSLFSADHFSDENFWSPVNLDFRQLFDGCPGIVDASNLYLPFIKMWDQCYEWFFRGCVNLVNGPHELFANELSSYCYNGMFAGCTSLVNAPLLPSLNKAEYGAYKAMFSGCTSLENAQILPATSINNSCYDNMYEGCTNLKYVKCLATNPSQAYLENWLRGVSATGTFVKKTNVTWPTGDNGIPNGWTVEESDD